VREGVERAGRARGDTVASHLAAPRERVAGAGLSVAPEDETACEGPSGSTLLRPALERLRDAVAPSRDRPGPPPRPGPPGAPPRLIRVLLVEGFGRVGAEVVFADRPIGVGAEQDLLLQVQGMITAHERGPGFSSAAGAGVAMPPAPDRSARLGQAALRLPLRDQGRRRRRGARRGRGLGRPARVRLMFARGSGWTA
jgi:hypothetical protein